MVMNPYIFILTYGLFFIYNIFYFLIIDNNLNNKNGSNTNLLYNNTNLLLNNTNFLNIQNQTNINFTNQIISIMNTNQDLYTQTGNLKNHSDNSISLFKKLSNFEKKEYKYFRHECYISDIIIHYKCE
jgi:hypothetical protein